MRRRRPLERQADREAAALGRRGDRGARLVVGLEGQHDVVGRDQQRDLRGERPALAREPDRGQRALADDHRVDELDRDVARVRARRRRGAERHEPAAAREALRHPVAEAGDAVGLGGEEAAVGLRALGEQRLEPPPVAAPGLTPGRPPCSPAARASREPRRSPRRCAR